MCSKSDTIPHNSLYTQTYLLVRFGCYGQRTQKSQNIVHGKEPHTLWRCVSHFSISPSTSTEKYSESISSFLPAQQPLLDHREHSCFAISEHARHWPHRDNSLAQTQWSISVSCRYTSISQPYNTTTILATYFARGISQIPFSTIATPETDVRQASHSEENYSRYGFDRSGSVWETGTCYHRLQSDQTWTSVISSSALFRWYNQRLHSRRVALRQHLYIEWNDISSRGIICKDTAFSKTCFYPRRQRVFRSRDYRKDRSTSRISLYHCGKIDQPDQETALFIALPYSSIWNPNGRVSLSTNWLEETIPIYRYSTTNIRRTNRSDYTVFCRQIQLPSDGNEYGTQTSQHLAFLQRSRWSRTYYQRTKERLSHSKDSDQAFCIKRIIFSHSLIFLQPGKLVQTIMFTSRISNNDARLVTCSPFTYSR